MQSEKIFSIIDLETSGPHFERDRIIEIGLIQVKNGKVINEYQTLVDPEKRVPEFILNMTGIREQDLEKAPNFEAIKEGFFDLLKGTVIVAHNVRFDYGFLKAEFKRHGLKFSEQNLCTVRLSRHLFPEYNRHNLDALIERFSLECEKRHRALDDAKVLKQFFDKLPDYFQREQINSTIKNLQRKVSLPPKLAEGQFHNIPETPGVYFFYGNSQYPLYIGKSKNIKKRVVSHFNKSHQSSKEMELFKKTTHIDFLETAGELGALILESELIKSEKPFHNKKLRKLKRMHVLSENVDKEGYKYIELCLANKLRGEDIDRVVGVFSSKDSAKNYIKDKAKEFVLCPDILENKKKKKVETDIRDCFYFELGLCLGACSNQEPASEFNSRFNEAFSEKRISSWPYEGPILINESYQDDPDRGEIFIFDKWCLLGRGEYYEDRTQIKINDKLNFDKDIYRILRGYLKKAPSYTTVKNLSPQELEKFKEEF